MVKTVLSHCCTATFNFLLLQTGDQDLNKNLDEVQDNNCSVLKLFHKYFEDCAGYSVFKQFTNWLSKNKKSCKKNPDHWQKKASAKKFQFGNLNKRLCFKLFVKSFHFLITMDNFYESERIHYRTAWSLCLRLRIARCVVIYMKSSFKGSKHLIDRVSKLNKTILRLVFNFFPTSVN